MSGGEAAVKTSQIYRMFTMLPDNDYCQEKKRDLRIMIIIMMKRVKRGTGKTKMTPEWLGCLNI